MTRRFFWIILLLLLLWAGASYYGYAVFRISMILLFAVLFFSLFSVLYLRTRVKLDPMRYSEEITRLESARYTLELSLRSLLLPAQLRMTAWSSQSHETVLSESRLLNLTVRPGEARRLVATLEGIHCGTLELGEIDLQVRDMFNIFWMRIPGVEKHLRFSTLVLPRLYYKRESTSLIKELIDEGELARISTLDTSDEIDTLRELQPGDTMRRIHWKVSARVQKFMIKQYEDPREIRYYVLLDPAYNENDLKDIRAREKENFARDDMLEFTASIISVLLDKKQWVELETWHPARMFQASNESGHLNYFRRQLALLPRTSERSMETQIERLNIGSGMSYYIFVVRSLTADLARRIAAFRKHSLGLMLCLMETSADPDMNNLYEELVNSDIKIVKAKDLISADNLLDNHEVTA